MVVFWIQARVTITGCPQQGAPEGEELRPESLGLVLEGGAYGSFWRSGRITCQSLEGVVVPEDEHDAVRSWWDETDEFSFPAIGVCDLLHPQSWLLLGKFGPLADLCSLVFLPIPDI